MYTVGCQYLLTEFTNYILSSLLCLMVCSLLYGIWYGTWDKIGILGIEWFTWNGLVTWSICVIHFHVSHPIPSGSKKLYHVSYCTICTVKYKFYDPLGIGWLTWKWMTHMELDDTNGPCNPSIPCESFLPSMPNVLHIPRLLKAKSHNRYCISHTGTAWH